MVAALIADNAMPLLTSSVWLGKTPFFSLGPHAQHKWPGQKCKFTPETGDASFQEGERRTSDSYQKWQTHQASFLRILPSIFVNNLVISNASGNAHDTGVSQVVTQVPVDFRQIRVPPNWGNTGTDTDAYGHSFSSKNT